jgi:hypothetical protein
VAKTALVGREEAGGTRRRKWEESEEECGVFMANLSMASTLSLQIFLVLSAECDAADAQVLFSIAHRKKILPPINSFDSSAT